MAHLDEISPAASAIGAVNTVHVRDDRTVGYNTDGEGFLQPLHALHVPLTTTTTCMLGAGGAARAVAMALLEAGCPVLVLANRTYERAARLVAILQGYFPQAQVRAVEAVAAPVPVLVLVAAVVVQAPSAAGHRRPLASRTWAVGYRRAWKHGLRGCP